LKRSANSMRFWPLNISITLFIYNVSKIWN